MMRDYTQEVDEFISDFEKLIEFNTVPDLLNLTALGMVLEPDYQWKTFGETQGEIEFYPHPNSDLENAGVLLSATGEGCYCAQSSGDIEEVEEWFTLGLEEYKESPAYIETFD